MYIHYSPSSYTCLIIWYNYTKLIIYNCSSYFGELRISTSVYFCNALEPKEPKAPRQQSTSLNWYTKTSKCLNNSKLTFLKASLAKAKEKAVFLSQLRLQSSVFIPSSHFFIIMGFPNIFLPSISWSCPLTCCRAPT